jgi:hypothetical protein
MMLRLSRALNQAARLKGVAWGWQAGTPGFQGTRLFSGYGNESAELIQAIREGRMEGIDPDDVRHCDTCTQMYHETLEGRNIEDLPPVCAVRGTWVKKWMVNHSSIYLYDALSLDASQDHDDDELRKASQEAMVIPEDGKRIKCGLYCCEDKKV